MGEVSAGDEIAGRYRLVRLLGEGGQGEVWEAASLSVGNLRVALKRVRHEGDGAQRAVKEAEMLARVRHPHVVAVHDVVPDGDDSWIVMDYVAGTSLARAGRISVEQAATYGAQLADGLAAAHAQGLLHRDVKPSNVLVDDDVATLLDFGIADSLWDAETDPGTSEEPGATAGGRVRGTPRYLAPELRVPDARYRRPADVFGLGVTLYEALEGTLPFGESGAGRSSDAADRTGMRTPRRSGAMAPLLTRMLREDPRERPDLEDVRDELRIIAAGGVPEPGDRAGRGRRRLVVAAGVLVLAVALGAYSWQAYGPQAGGTAPTARAAAKADAPAEAERGRPDPADAAATRDTSPSAEPTAAPAPTATPAANDGANAGRADEREKSLAAPLRFPAKSGQAAREASWDPCKLLHAGALDSFGTASIDSDRGEFQKCHVTVADGSSASEVELTMFTGEDPGGSVVDEGDGVTVHASESDDECTRDVVFGPDDRYTLSFEAYHVKGSGADLCDLVRSVADRAVSDVVADDIPVRTTEPLPGSVIGHSTCALPSDGALRSALNVDSTVSPRREFAEWDCTWDGDDGRDLRLLFQRNEGYDPGDGTEFSASGRTAYERGDAWGEGCLVDVVARQGPSPEGDGPVSELLRVHLTGESDRDTLCEDAMAVARSAASSL